MIKRLIQGTLSLLSILVLGSSMLGSIASAATFNNNNIIDDAVFDNYTSMDAGAIDNFLNQQPNSCISSRNGFLSSEPTGYTPSDGYTYSGAASAGTVIYDTAHVYGINPQVLIATLEKESSIVTGNASYHCDYINTSMGFDCPDGGHCPLHPDTEYGFSKQLIHAAWLLKFSEQRSEGNVGWNVQLNDFPQPTDHWDNSDDPQACYPANGPITEGYRQLCPSGATNYYDGSFAIDGTALHIDNGATASLYRYTPHFHGNQLFFDIFNGWFGSTYANGYSAQFNAQSPLTNPFYPGETSTVYVQYKNTGTQDWYDNTSAPSNTPPVHLAANVLNGQQSIFGYGWPSGGRPAVNFSNVYEANGTTAASNQHIVRPGQIGRFSFTITPPWNVSLGVQRIYFQPVLENAVNWNMGGSSWLDINVDTRYKATFNKQSIVPAIKQNDQPVTVFFQYKNTGSAAWYDDTSVVSGYKPTHLATSAPVNRWSGFGPGWTNRFRPAVLFSAVYEADGTTLAGNQHVVMPGQIGKFSFPMAASANIPAGGYREYFQPIEEGSYQPFMGGVSWFDNNVTASTFSAQFNLQSAFPNLNKGQTKPVFLQYKNTGNVTWYDDTSVPAGASPVHLAATAPTNRSSVFSYGWPSSGRPNVTFTKVYEADGVTLATNQHTVTPGQIGRFDFNVTAPWNISPGTHREYFQPVLEGANNWSFGGVSWQDITTN